MTNECTAATLCTVDVRADDRTWFTPAEMAAVTPAEADALVAELRDRGFEARTRLLDD